MIGGDIYPKDGGRARGWREMAAEHLQGGGLAAPLGPMNMKNSLALVLRLRSCTAFSLPNRFVRAVPLWGSMYYRICNARIIKRSSNNYLELKFTCGMCDQSNQSVHLHQNME